MSAVLSRHHLTPSRSSTQGAQGSGDTAEDGEARQDGPLLWGNGAGGHPRGGRELTT